MSKELLVYATWWISGAISGLTLVQLLVAEETLSWTILLITLSLLTVDIIIVGIFLRRIQK